MREFARNRNVLVLAAAAAFASCSGGSATMPSNGSPAAVSGGGDSVPASAPAISAAQVAPNALGPVQTDPGAVNGLPDRYSPASGDYPGGGQGKDVDGIGCFPTMVQNEYHVHVFLGVVHGGKLIANPRAIGMVDPGAPVNGFVNTASCFYRVHTHDSSGIVHIELNRSLSQLPIASDAPFRFRTILEIWGVPHTASSFGPFHGPMHVFVGNVPAGTLVVNSYTPYNGKLDDIKLRSHEVIWIEIGTKYYTATQLPPVKFYMEY